MFEARNILTSVCLHLADMTRLSTKLGSSYDTFCHTVVFVPRNIMISVPLQLHDWNIRQTVDLVMLNVSCVSILIVLDHCHVET